MQEHSPIVLLGGTFDPIHFGHLRTALELQQHFGETAEVRLIPCGDPRHRAAPKASGEHRLAMLRLALEGEPGLRIDEVEVRRTGASYTVDTLLELRQEVGNQRPLIFVMGTDAFESLPKWRRWLEIIQLAHIMVVNRPGWSFCEQGELGDFLRQHSAESNNDLIRQPAGKVGFITLTQMGISSSKVRELIGLRLSPRFLLPDSVWRYIRQHRLYGAVNA
ncbi:nicotinate-nucleotide adenylyltransferase [Hahella sp. KA22]|uniref:nicotinate-nucleotide adenylyltransferase n=1 Tax=Hahella sp. KA22 TaxID=1628392 RepID=UPI000FDDE524|nr:nicotinate-nucleotide adenylyltransferase [Hahella sp. KA22]AZZ90530.1 nicotinate-nucleotide adenylyltransferase [Hahella sp. KA22]QAY53900.1 nicotinate-nucleotide adenylyltransferase [Hahella sp. KA22]